MPEAPGGSPFRLSAGILLATGAVTLLLPWTTDPTSIGISEGDGRIALVIAAVGFVMWRQRVKFAWMAPGLVTVVLVRDLLRVQDAGITVGVGLWLGIAAFAGSALLLIADLLRRAARLRRDSAAG